MVFKVFISHSVVDIQLVVDFSATLKQTGIETYVAEDDIRVGEHLPTKIENQIEKSDCVLALLTKEGDRSSSVNQEIGYAKKAGKLIIPIVEKGIKMGVFLQGIELIYLTATNPQEAIDNATAYINNLKLSKEQRELIILCAIGAISFIALAILIAKSSEYYGDSFTPDI